MYCLLTRQPCVRPCLKLLVAMWKIPVYKHKVYNWDTIHWSSWWSESGEREVQSRGDMRNRIKNRCFKTLIWKLVNLLQSLNDRIAIHIWIDFFCAPLDLMAWQQLFLLSKAAQHGLVPIVACSRGWGLCKFQGLWHHQPRKKLVVVPTSRNCRH